MTEAYDRELIARMLTELSSMGSSIFLGESISAQAELLIAADNAAAAGTRTASIAPAEAKGDGMLPDALVPVADEWYRLCERRFAVDKIKISGELAEAIVEAMSALRVIAAAYRATHHSACELLEALERLVDASSPETTGWSEAVEAIRRATQPLTPTNEEPNSDR